MGLLDFFSSGQGGMGATGAAGQPELSPQMQMQQAQQEAAARQAWMRAASSLLQAGGGATRTVGNALQAGMGGGGAVAGGGGTGGGTSSWILPGHPIDLSGYLQALAQAQQERRLASITPPPAPMNPAQQALMGYRQWTP